MINCRSGEIRQAQVFFAVLGASSYTFAEATWSQYLPDWLGSHARAFLGRVTKIVVTDNLRSAVFAAFVFPYGWYFVGFFRMIQ